MIETSTPASRNLCEKAKSEGICASEDLTEEEESFYNQLKPELSRIVKTPSSHTIDNIIKYSLAKK